MMPLLLLALVALLASPAHAAASTLSQVCPVAPTYSYVDIVADPDGGAIEPFVYNITGNYDKKPIPQALVYRINLTQGSQADDICYGVTDPATSPTPGKAHFPYDPKFEGCLDNWFIFCPNGDISNPRLREMCLNGTGLPQHKISSDPIPRCDGKTAPPLAQNQYLLSHNEFYYCNYNPADLAPLCWPLMLIFSLLVAASYAVGRNPFMAFDFSSPRMNRGRAYTTRAQQKSFDAMSIGYGINSMSSAAAKMGAFGKNNKDFSLFGALSKAVGGAVANIFKPGDKKDGKVKVAESPRSMNGKKEEKKTDKPDATSAKGTVNFVNQTVNSKGKSSSNEKKEKVEPTKKLLSASSSVGYMAPNLIMALLDLFGIKKIGRSDADKERLEYLSGEMKKGYFKGMWAALTYRFKGKNDWGMVLFRAIMETAMRMAGRGNMSRGLTNAIMLVYFIDQPQKLPFGLNFLSEPIMHAKAWVETLGMKEAQLLGNGWVCIDKKDNVWARKLEDGKWEIFEKNTIHCAWEKEDGSWTLYNGKEYADWKPGGVWENKGLDPTKYVSDANGLNTLKNEVNDNANAQMTFLAVRFVDGKWKAEGLTAERHSELQNENLKLLNAQQQFDMAIRNMIHIGEVDSEDKMRAARTSSVFNAEPETKFDGNGEKLDENGKELIRQMKNIAEGHLLISWNDIKADKQSLYQTLDKAVISALADERGMLRIKLADLEKYGKLADFQKFAPDSNGYATVEYSKLTLEQKQGYIDNLVKSGKAQDLLERVDRLLDANEKFVRYESISQTMDARSQVINTAQKSLDATEAWNEERTGENLEKMRNIQRNYEFSDAALKSAVFYSQIEDVKKELFDRIAEIGSANTSERNAKLHEIEERLVALAGPNQETQKWYDETMNKILADGKIDINEYQDLTEKQKEYLNLHIMKRAYDDSLKTDINAENAGTKHAIENSVRCAADQYKIDQTRTSLVANWKGPEEDLDRLVSRGLQTSHPDQLRELAGIYSVDLEPVSDGYINKKAAEQLEKSRSTLLEAYLEFMQNPTDNKKLIAYNAALDICKKDFGGVFDALGLGGTESEKNRRLEDYFQTLYKKDRDVDLNTFDNKYVFKSADGKEVTKTYREIIAEPYAVVKIPSELDGKTVWENKVTSDPNPAFLEILEKIKFEKAQNRLEELKGKSERGEYEIPTQTAIEKLQEGIRDYQKKLEESPPKAKMELLLGNNDVASKIGETKDNLYFYSKEYRQRVEAENREALLGPAYLTDYDEIVKDAMQNDRIYRQMNISQLTGAKLKEDLKNMRQEVEEIIEKHKTLESLGSGEKGSSDTELEDKYEQMSRLPGALGDAWKHGLKLAKNKAEYVDVTQKAYHSGLKADREADIINAFEQAGNWRRGKKYSLLVDKYIEQG